MRGWVPPWAVLQQQRRDPWQPSAEPPPEPPPPPPKAVRPGSLRPVTVVDRRPDGSPSRVSVSGVGSGSIGVYAPRPGGYFGSVGEVLPGGQVEFDDHGQSKAAAALLRPGGSHQLAAVPLVGGRVACLAIVKK